ncbi:MAG: hypothetical protein H5T83_01015 [Actinotalea sp.]|nr:hypothetical protein [Actinotalea sp.]
MTAPEEFTRQQAADPATPPQVLADIAALRADLRPVVALNPAAYPGLLDWLGSLGEPGVDTALRRRAEAAYGASAGAAPSPAPWDAPAPGGWGVPAPGTHPYGPTPAGHRPGPGPYGPTPTGPPEPRRRTGLWVALAVVGVVVVLGIAAIAFLAQVLRGLGSETEATYGDDPALDALWDACAAEDWAACDALYEDSPPGSEYERFADTCGDRTQGGVWCVEEFGAPTGAGRPGPDGGATS